MKTAHLPWRTFDEESVIERVLESSPEFRAYYKGERGKVPGTVLWAEDKSLPRGIDYRSTQVGPGIHVIRLKRIPAVIRDAMGIAHELQHIVLVGQGFPRPGAIREFESLSSSLNSMVHDPLVDARLHDYGFDVLEAYRGELKNTKRQLKRYQSSPVKHDERMLWIFNYVAKILDWKLISAHAQVGEDNFRRWFDRRYPDVAREAQGVLDLVEKIGYGTPEKQAQLFRQIIRTYDLAGHIVF